MLLKGMFKSLVMLCLINVSHIWCVVIVVTHGYGGL